MESMIKFKFTTGTRDIIELAYESKKTIEAYIQDLAELYDAEPQQFKLVSKGKILNWKDSAEQTKINQSTVMVVLNNHKK